MPKDEILDGSEWKDVEPQAEEVLDGSTWTEVKKKDVPAPKLESGSEATISSNGQSKSTSVSPIVSKPNPNNQTSFTVSKENSFGIPNFKNQVIPGVTPIVTPANKSVLGTGTTVKETTQTSIETPQYDVSGATKQQSDNTDTGLVNISQQAESKRVAQEAEKVKREQELANPNSFQNIGTLYKEKALKTTGNNDIEKMLNFGDINGNKAFVEATLDDNDKHILGVTKEIEKINNDNKIYDQQLKSGAITQEIYDAHKKENTKKSIDLNAEYVKGIQSRNSAIDDEIKQSQTKLANGYDIKMLGAQSYYEPLTTQQIDEEKKKIKTLTDLKNDVLIDVNNPIKSLEKHEGFQNAEKDGLIPSGATNTQKVRIYSYILADKAKKLATELGYNPNDVKSLMGDKFGSNTPKMFWESAKSLIFGSNPKEKEFVHTMAELQAIAPISILNKNNLNLNEGYISNIVSSFRKSVAPMFPRNQIATDQDRNALTQEAFNQAGVNQDVNSAYTTQQGNVDKESKNIGKTVSRTAGDIFGIGVKVAGINTLLGIPGQAIEMAVGKPVIQGLDKALSTSKEAQALEYTKLSETATKTASEAKKVEDAKKVLDVAKVVTEKLPNNFLTRTIYGTLKSGIVHEIQGRVNDELKGFANFGVGSVNHLIGMPINALGQVAIKMFGKEAPLFVEKVIEAAQSGTAMTATMAGMTVVNAARETEDMGAFKDVLDQHFGTKEKALRFVAENFLLGLALHAVNANTVSGLFKSKYDEGYSKLSPEEKAKVDDFVKDTNEKANDFETATKDAVEQVQKDDHVPLTTDKEIDDNAKALDQATNVNPLKDVESTTTALNDDLVLKIEEKANILFPKSEQTNEIISEAYHKAKADGSNPELVKAVEEALQQTKQPAETKVTVSKAVIEIGGKMYEGNNHAEAILKAKADGQDISQVNRQAEGKFKLSDGTIIDRAEAKTRFGQDRSELIIPQDENAKEANKEYAKITRKPLSKIAEKIKLDENQVTPIKPINTGQEQNNIGGVQQTPENNQGFQQGDGQNVSNENEVAKVEEEQEVGSGVGGDVIFYTGRGKKYEDLKNTKGEFIFFSKNPKISEWYGGDESNVSEAKLDTSNFLDLTTQESKSKFVKENFTDKDIEELYSDEIKYEENTDRFGRKTRESLINKYRERAVENRFSGDGKEQQFLLNKIKEQGHSGVKLLDTHFGKSDISYVIIDKSKIQQSLKETTKEETTTTNAGVEEGSSGVGGDVGSKSILKSDVDLKGDKKKSWMRKNSLDKISVNDINEEGHNNNLSSAKENVKAGKKSQTKEAPLVEIDENGNATIIDGHHRIAEDILDGKSHIEAVVDNKFNIRDAIKDGLYEKAISEGRMTAKDAKEIIESAGLKIPKAVEDALKPTPEVSKPVSKVVYKGEVKSADIEDKKADIERRRREDLQKGQLFLMNDGTYGGSRLVSLEEYSTIQIQENNLDSDVTKWDYNTFNDTGIFVNLSLGVAYIVPNNSYNGKKAEVVKVFINKTTKRFDLSNPRIINTPNIELVAKAANIDSKELYNEVLNAITKYDAELAAIETPEVSKPASEVVKPISKTETTENPALKSVESTAKAFDLKPDFVKDEFPINKDYPTTIKKIFNKDSELVWISDGKESYSPKSKEGKILQALLLDPLTHNSPKDAKYIHLQDRQVQAGTTFRLKEATSKGISEAYHKAKADGSNPELVKAVEDALNPTPEVSKPVSEIAKAPISKTETTENPQPVLPETKAQKVANPRLSALPKKKEVPTEKVEEGVDKKADIEIGKVGNTEYEVKVDGVYYQGKKLNNPKNKTHRQLIEADIERRREEELDKNSTIEIPRYFTFKELGGGKGKSGKALSSVESDKNDEIQKEFESKLIEGDKLIEPNGDTYFFKNNKVVKSNGQPRGMADIGAFINGVTIDRTDKINAKYDAELVESTAKALEKVDTKSLKTKLGVDANWDMIGEGDLFDSKSPEDRYTQRLLSEWYRASQKGEINPNSKITYDIVRGRFGGQDQKDVVQAKDENGIIIGVVKLSGKLGIEHIAVAPEFRGKGVADKLIKMLKENNPNLDLSKTELRSKGFDKAFGNKIIAEAYHKAKADGSNPELVKAVEEALSPTPEVSKPVSEVLSEKEQKKKEYKEYKQQTPIQQSGEVGSGVSEDVIFDKQNNKYNIQVNNFTKEDGRKVIRVKVTSLTGERVADVAFFKDVDGKYYANNLLVQEKNRRKGVASSIYNFIESNFAEIKPSKLQTKDGKLFSENRKQSLKEQPKTEPQELIGTKNAMTEQEMERMGITPPEKLKSKPYQEQIKVAREGIDNGTVDPYTIVDDILSTENIEDTAIKPSYEPALQLHLVDLKNKVNVANDRIIEIEKQLQKEPDNLELQGEISDLNAQIIQAETDREQALMAVQKAGTVWGNYGQNRQNVIDLQDIVQAKINRIKALYNGEPPKEVKEKLESLQRENDRLEAENRRITKEFNESQQQQDTAEFQKQLQQEYERGLVEGGNKASYQKRAKSIADSVRKLKTKPPVLKDANGNEIKITQNALFPTASWNDAVEILAKSIETAGTFADGLANGIEKVKKHLESYGWYSKLSDKDKESVVGLVKDSISAKDEQNKRLKIPRGYLKDIIESKGITDINKLVEEVKNDYPDKSDREIRDAITGYGVTSEPSSEPVDVALRKMNRKGRILSALEDLDEGIRPDRSGAKRDVLEDDERADLKKIRDGIKELPQSDEDLSKKMKSAQDAIETRIKNRIADIKLILDGKAKDIKTNKVEDTEEITKLRDEKEQWEQKLVDFKAKNKQSDALDAIQKLADKNGSTTVSKEMVTNGHIKDVITSQIQDGVPLKDIAENTVNLLKPILPDITQKDVTDALLKKGNFATEKTTKKDLQIQLSDLKAQLNLKEKIANLENGIIQKTKEKGATSDEVKELQKQLAETKQRAKNEFAGISSAELERQIKATQNKIYKGEFFKIPVDKKTFENDKQWLENKKRLDDIKKKLNILEQNARESKKTTAMIIADVVTQNIGRRLVFFGSQAYQVKLSVAAFTTLLTKLPKEVLGQVFTTMFPKIGKDAQIEGDFDLGAVGKFYGEALNPLKLAKGTANIALTGKNTLDQTLETHPERQYTLAKLRDDYNADYAWYAKYPKIVASIMSSNHIPGLDLLTTDPHVMIKDPIKRGSYEFAFMKIMNHYKSLGMELNNPLLIGMAQDAAFRYAKAEIFMGSGLDKSGKRKDPSFTDKINAYFNGIENSAIEEANKKGGNQVSAHSKYALVKLYNFLYPVVGVPSRILGTVVKSNPISFSKDLMSAAIINRKVTKGIESLSNNQADMIIRQLKEGAIGSAMWTLGFVATMNMLKKQDEERKKNKLKLGGYYTGYIDKKDRIRENLLQPNDFIINNDGHDKYLTHNAQHSTAVMAIQAGATLATLFYHFNNPHLDYKAIETDGVKRYQMVIAQDDKASSVKKATVGLAGSLADQHPIVQTSYDIYESTQTDKGREAYIRNIKNRLDVKKKAQKLKDGILDLNFFEDTPGH